MSDLYLDTSRSPEQRAPALLEELSLPEKMAQVRGIFPFGAYGENWEAISRMTKNGIGQVSTLQMREFHTKEACCAWQRKIQEIVMENSPHHIPAAFHMEGLCGAFIQGSVSLPSGIARGAGWDTALEEQLGRVVSRQEAACGITQTLAPVLDVAREPRMGRHGEPYGEDPTLVAAMGTAYLKGLQAEKTAGRETEGAAKHFLAFHNSQGGIHGTHSLTTSRELQEVYGKPFQAAIAKGGLRGVMPCYCLIDGEPVHASRKLLTGLLREEMGFAGVTVSDYSGVAHTHEDQHVEETMEEAALRCMAAGMDVELPSEHAYSDGLEQLFATGKADIAILDQAVLRVLTAKFRTGLFEHPFALEGEELDSAFFDGGDRELTLRSARESLVLLKNDGLLPLPKKGLTIALIGPQADHANKFFGGYTHVAMAESTYAVRASIAGVDQEGAQGPGVTYVPGTQIQSDETPEIQAVLKHQKPGCKSLLQELRDRLPEARILYAYGYPVAGEDDSGCEEALAQIAQADVAVLTLGGKHGTCSISSMGEGVDATSINLPPCQESFIRQAAALGKPLLALHLDGRPHLQRCRGPMLRRHPGVLEPCGGWRPGNLRRAAGRLQPWREAARVRGTQRRAGAGVLQPPLGLRLAPERKHRLYRLCGLPPPAALSFWLWPVLHQLCLCGLGDFPGGSPGGRERGDCLHRGEYRPCPWGRGGPALHLRRVRQYDPPCQGAGGFRPGPPEARGEKAAGLHFAHQPAGLFGPGHEVED